jgi:calcineurin-like phosphoesterase family protein
MPNLWFTSDWHLGHVRIAAYCGRPADWEEKIWESVNSRVGPEDTLIHLGDYAFRQKSQGLAAYWERMPLCKTILVMGNHDKRSKNQRLPWTQVIRPCEQPFGMVLAGVPAALGHEPEKMPADFDGIFLHGHTHEKGTRYSQVGPTFIVNCCVEQTAYRPLSLDEIMEEYRLRKSI